MATDWWTTNAPPNANPGQFNRYGGGMPPTGGITGGTAYDPTMPGHIAGGYAPINDPGGQRPGGQGFGVATGGGGGGGGWEAGPGVAPTPGGYMRSDSGGQDPGGATGPVGGNNPATAADAGPQNGDYQGWFSKLVAGKPYNQQTLLDLEPTLNKYGIQLTPPNAAGERTKINIPGQGWTRVGFGEGKPVWIPQGHGGGGGGAGGGGGGAFGKAQEELSGHGLTPYQAPNFTPPTDITMQNDPGYKARMALGQEAIEGSAAARGGILSGGTLKALDRYAQDYASGEYGNVFNRAAQTSGINAGIGQLGYQNRYGQYQDWQNWNQQNANRGQRAGSDLYRPPPQ